MHSMHEIKPVHLQRNSNYSNVTRKYQRPHFVSWKFLLKKYMELHFSGFKKKGLHIRIKFSVNCGQ